MVVGGPGVEVRSRCFKAGDDRLVSETSVMPVASVSCVKHDVSGEV